jgi:cytochrome c553
LWNGTGAAASVQIPKELAMKSITLLALTLLVGTSLSAQMTLAEKMIKSESGLNNIQKGFLYNNVALIKTGLEQVKTANRFFKDAEATKAYLPKEKAHMNNIAYNAAKRIDTAADEVAAYLDANELTKAQYAATDIITACSSCHATVRGW